MNPFRNSTTTRTRTLGGAALLLAATAAQATDGYFANGYGLKSIGMGGAAAAVALEPFGGAVNPGAMSFLDNQWQLGAAWFRPERSASRTGSGTFDGTPTGGWGIDGSVESDSIDFIIPEFGVNWRYRPDLAFGVTVFGNGGMNTDYPGGQIPAASTCGFLNPGQPSYNLLCGTGTLGVDLSQLLIAPYVSWQFSKGHSVGIAPLIGYQRFKAEGLQAFEGFSTSPGSVTNNGYSSAWGGGVRIGYMGEFADGKFALGAAWASKVNMGEFEDYKGLFAQGGGFDIPSNFTLGIALRPTAQWLIALDFERIFYSDTKSVSNPSSLIYNCAGGPGGVPPPDPSACLGGSNGAGFGWQDINVWKIGVQYQVSDRWTLRGGFNYSQNPIEPQDVTFNILAPGVVQSQWSLGATWKIDAQSDLTGAFMYAQNNSVTGSSLFAGFGAPPTTTETIQMKEYLIGLAYSRKF